MLSRCYTLGFLTFAAALFPADQILASTSAAELLAKYGDHAAFEQRVADLEQSEHVSVRSLGETAEGRDIQLIVVGEEQPDKKPAILVVGSVEGDRLVGSELSLRVVEQLIGSDNADHKKLLDEVTLYVIPRPTPDANEQLFAKPLPMAAANTRSTDDDRDGDLDEDPPEDLSGDGLITSVRVEDEAGDYIPHPQDDRVLIKADPTKGERGKYRLLSEGIDNDADKRWNEDGPGGVHLNRNFPFEYPYFKPGAGAHQVSEPETRALADFCYEHPNIFLVLSIAPQDNLNHPWKPGKGKPGVDPRIKTSVNEGDAKYLKRIAKRYQKLAGAKHAPDSSSNDGAFVPWSYYHYGRWSIATRGWWVPMEEDVDKEEDSTDSEPENTDADKQDDESDVKPDESPIESDKATKDEKDKRGEQDFLALSWLDANGIAGFVDWSEQDHPDFPGKKVEVGGFISSLRSHPPLNLLDAKPLVSLLGELSSQRAQIAFASVKQESLGGNIHRITTEIVNRGELPTSSAMGKISKQLRRLEVELHGPKSMKLLANSRRQDLGVLAPGEVAERTWLVQLPNGDISSLSLRAGEPSVGFVEADVAEHSEEEQ